MRNTAVKYTNLYTKSIFIKFKWKTKLLRLRVRLGDRRDLIVLTSPQ